jgi:FtsZ-interacting cell division protein ZipA
MENLTFKRVLLIVGIIALVAIVFVFVESRTFQSNVKNAKPDSTQVEQLAK